MGIAKKKTVTQGSAHDQTVEALVRPDVDIQGLMCDRLRESLKELETMPWELPAEWAFGWQELLREDWSIECDRITEGVIGRATESLGTRVLALQSAGLFPTLSRWEVTNAIEWSCVHAAVRGDARGPRSWLAIVTQIVRAASLISPHPRAHLRHVRGGLEMRMPGDSFNASAQIRLDIEWEVPTWEEAEATWGSSRDLSRSWVELAQRRIVTMLEPQIGRFAANILADLVRNPSIRPPPNTEPPAERLRGKR